MRTKEYSLRVLLGRLVSGVIICALLISSAVVVLAASGSQVNDGWQDDSTNKTLTATIGTLDEFTQFINFCIQYNDYTYDITITNDIVLNAGDTIQMQNSGAFEGSFNGGGYTITLNGAALFSSVSNATISNVNLAGSVTVSNSDTAVGALACEVSNVVVENCSSVATVTSSNGSGSYVGGLIGTASNCTMTDCSNVGAVTAIGVDYTAGLVASVSGDFSMTNCSNSGTVTGQTAGGLIGETSGTVTISDSYNEGSVTGTVNAGGIAGVVQTGSTLTATGSVYNSATITAGASVSTAAVGSGSYDENQIFETSTPTATDDDAYTLETGVAYIFPDGVSGVQNDENLSDGCNYVSGSVYYVADAGDYTYIA